MFALLGSLKFFYFQRHDYILLEKITLVIGLCELSKLGRANTKHVESFKCTSNIRQCVPQLAIELTITSHLTLF